MPDAEHDEQAEPETTAEAVRRFMAQENWGSGTLAEAAAALKRRGERR